MNFEFGFKEADRKAVINKFLSPKYWGGENGGYQFLKLIEAVLNFEWNNNVQITDILIKNEVTRHSPPYLGILKHFFPGRSLVIEEMSSILLRNFIKRAMELKGIEKVNFESDKLFFEFSLALYTFGFFRITVSTDSENLVVNIRKFSSNIPEIDTLGYPVMYIEFLESLFSEKQINFTFQEKNTVPYIRGKIKSGGLIIHAGETGSGKTTSIASELKFIAERIAGLIICYENPIEYRFLTHPNILQYEIDVNIEQNKIFQHFLRSSPMVGFFHEVKTREEFRNVIDLASRGHLIFTTVHASSVYEVLSSFSYLEPEVKNLFATVLKAIICQKLLMNSQGKIVPFYEIFLAKEGTEPIIQKYLNNEIVRIKNILYIDRSPESYNYFYSFSDCIKERLRNKEITESEIRENFYNYFSKYNLLKM